jgi:hypothetical protein
MMLLGSIIIPASPWVWAAVLGLVTAVLLLFWLYRRSPELGAVHKIAFCLRLLGVLVLGFCLVEPLWSGKRAKSGANLFLVVADKDEVRIVHC